MKFKRYMRIIRGQIDIGAFNICQFMDGEIEITVRRPGEAMKVDLGKLEEAIAKFYDKYF